MTELAQEQLEHMTEELEDMKRLKLFTEIETRIIFKKRKEFEHNLQASEKMLKYYEDYITYERCLLKDIRLRRDKFRIVDKRQTIEHRIIKRIKLLYQTALRHFADHIPLFLAFLKFCKKANCTNALADTIQSFLKLHPDKPDIWKVAGNWYAYDRRDVNAAMSVLLRGVQLHKDNQMLYKELITVEIFNVVTNFANIDSTVARVKVTILEIFKHIKDTTFYMELLTLFEHHRFTIDIQNSIIEKVKDDHYDDENVWHGLGQREYRGVYLGADTSNQQSQSTKMLTTKGKLEACFAQYKEGLSIVSPDTKRKLWHLYLSFLINLHREPLGCATVLRRTTLHWALHEACADNALLETHFKTWLDLKDDEDAMEIAVKGTKAYPGSVDLWKLRLKMQIIKGDSVKVDEVFKLSTLHLKEKALPLWESILRYHFLSSDSNYVELIYKDAIKQPGDISKVLQPQYLEWLALNSIDAARAVYNEISVQKPYNKEVHKMMAKLESLQIDRNYIAWENTHELACQQFGREDADVWIDYMQFYLFYYPGHTNPAERINVLHQEAGKKLNSNGLFDFLNKYNKIIKDHLMA